MIFFFWKLQKEYFQLTAGRSDDAEYCAKYSDDNWSVFNILCLRIRILVIYRNMHIILYYHLDFISMLEFAHLQPHFEWSPLSGNREYTFAENHILHMDSHEPLLKISQYNVLPLFSRSFTAFASVLSASKDFAAVVWVPRDKYYTKLSVSKRETMSRTLLDININYDVHERNKRLVGLRVTNKSMIVSVSLKP